MAKLKISSRISGDCTQNVHNFGQIPNFWSGNNDYEMVSNCQSPRGHPPWWGTVCKEAGKLGR